jgi:Secretion system C-terminal sorting domain/Domain of unknown function (DUF5122) beta-propeller
MTYRYALAVLSLATAIAAHAQEPAIAWEAFFDGSLPGEDVAHALLIAPDNSIYVTGSSANIAPQGTITTIRYAPDGSQLWADHPYGPSQDSQNKGVDLVIDPWGHVFVCGNFSANNGDLCVIKYKPSGRIWRRNFEQYPMADVLDEATGIAMDANGEVYVSGYITSTAGMGLESYILKVDSAGNELWHDAFSPSSADETASDIVVSPAGNVYVGGDWWDIDGGGIDISMARYSASGTQAWNESFEGAGMTDRTARLSPTMSDGVLAAGSATIGASPDAVILARSATGTELWSVVHAGTGNADDDAVDMKELSDGRVAAVVHSREVIGGSLRHTITTLLIDASNVVWSAQYIGDAGLGAWPTCLVVDAGDNIHIGGYAIATGGASTDGVVLKYNSSGTLMWDIAYDGGSNLDDRFNAIGVNTAGDVVVCGTTATSPSASKYVTVQFGNAVGVQEEGGLAGIPAVFPNPVAQTLHVGLDPALEVEVFNALGERIMPPRRVRSIDVSEWNDGVYFVKTGDRTQRIVIHH